MTITFLKIDRTEDFRSAMSDLGVHTSYDICGVAYERLWYPVRHFVMKGSVCVRADFLHYGSGQTLAQPFTISGMHHILDGSIKCMLVAHVDDRRIGSTLEVKAVSDMALVQRGEKQVAYCWSRFLPIRLWDQQSQVGSLRRFLSFSGRRR